MGPSAGLKSPALDPARLRAEAGGVRAAQGKRMDGQPIRVRIRTILMESATLGALAVLVLWLPWARASQPTDAKADTLAQQAVQPSAF